MAFSHRGYPPSSEIGVPDPKEFTGDLAALIEHLQRIDVCLTFVPTLSTGHSPAAVDTFAQIAPILANFSDDVKTGTEVPALVFATATAYSLPLLRKQYQPPDSASNSVISIIAHSLSVGTG